MYNNRKAWNHVSEMMEFFHTFTQDNRYHGLEKFLIEESRKREVKMCTLLDKFEKEGIQKGHKEGQYLLAESFSEKNNISIEDSMIQLGFSKDEKTGYYAWKSDKTA